MKAELVQVKEIDKTIMKDVMIKILQKEKLFLNPNIVTSIATRARGDIRAAITDLQTVSRMKDPSELTLDQRNKEVDIFSALKMVFQGKPWNEDNREHLIIELGDVMWYVAQATMALDISFDEVIETNVNKLKKRYPGGEFNVHNSEVRAAGDR